eukprot:m.121791 g.121791  ORF g.121791 m.121791 type:complete len:580 (-) comp13706_c2_seq2:272-2011(-)
MAYNAYPPAQPVGRHPSRQGQQPGSAAGLYGHQQYPPAQAQGYPPAAPAQPAMAPQYPPQPVSRHLSVHPPGAMPPQHVAQAPAYPQAYPPQQQQHAQPYPQQPPPPPPQQHYPPTQPHQPGYYPPQSQAPAPMPQHSQYQQPYPQQPPPLQQHQQYPSQYPQQQQPAPPPVSYEQQPHQYSQPTHPQPAPHPQRAAPAPPSVAPHAAAPASPHAVHRHSSIESRQSQASFASQAPSGHRMSTASSISEDFAAYLGQLTIQGVQEQGTLVPYQSFNSEADAAALKKAMKGLGCDRAGVTQVLAHRTDSQRQEIALKFKTMYGKDLNKMMFSEVSGDYRDVVMALLKPAPLRDALWLRNAMRGAGTDERCIIEILVSRTGREIAEIRAAYKQELGRDLEKDIASDTSGHFRRLLIALSQGNRDPEATPVDRAKAAVDAQRLYKAGLGRWGTDEVVFNEVFCLRSAAQLRLTFEEYNKISKHDIFVSIKKEMSGDLKHGFLAIAKCVANKHEYFAERIYKSMKGLGTDDATLIRCIVSRCEIDMVQIKDAFRHKYGKSMAHWIRGDTSGHYEKILLRLIGE